MIKFIYIVLLGATTLVPENSQSDLTDNCFYTLDLKNISCDKKEVKFHKKRDSLNSVGYLEIIIYKEFSRIVENTKGCDAFKSNTISTIRKSFRENKFEFKKCDSIITYIKMDFRLDKISFVQDKLSFEKLNREYCDFEFPVRSKIYYGKG